MKPQIYNSGDLKKVLTEQKVGTLEGMKTVLGTDVSMTVFRKLKEIGYYSSYSHAGKYYTLEKIARFDEHGLWSFNDIWFSMYGTLVSTVEVFVTKSDSGYFTRELDRILHVSTKKVLLKLVQENRIAREHVSGFHLHCSVDSTKRGEQLRTRRLEETELMLGHGLTGLQVAPDELKAAIILFFSLLNEKERRLYAALESLKQGYGGDRKVAELLGIDVHTVAKGREALLQGEIEHGRIRKAGAGRKPIKKNARSD